jgi:hypothetical protein
MELPSEITLIDVTGKRFTFKALENLQDFLKTEANFWEEKDNQSNTGGPSNPYFKIFNSFHNSYTQIDSWENVSSWDTTTFNNQLGSVISNYFNQFPSYWIWSGHDFIETWLESYEYSDRTGDAFLDVILKKQLNHRDDFSILRGYILAYEFIQQGDSLLTKRRLAEKATFATVRGQLSKKKDELITEVTDFQNRIIDWKDLTQNEIDTWQKNQIKHHDDTALNHSTHFQERISAWTKNVGDLEDKYKEKLRFDGPATYWKESAAKFRKQGYYWTFLLVLLSSVFIVYLSNFFIVWLSGQKVALKLETLEGVVLFATIVSAFAILIKTFSRFAFSSFHLQRDAEEREQLTHLYLSLSNEQEVDAESRKIVLQALFSRSETGLLANESGPTMPGIGEVVNYIGKVGK